MWTKDQFLQEQPTAAPIIERQVSAAADIGTQISNGCTQSAAALRIELKMSARLQIQFTAEPAAKTPSTCSEPPSGKGLGKRGSMVNVRGSALESLARRA